MDLRAERFSELDKAPSISAYSAAARKIASYTATLPVFRLAVLSNHTFHIGTPLSVECARRDLQLVLYEAAYDQYRQEILDPESGMSSFHPDAVLISLHLESAFPNVSASACAETQEMPSAEDWASNFQRLLLSYRERSRSPIFVQNFLPPAGDMEGLLAASGARPIFDWTMELNARLRRMAGSLGSVFVIDAARLAANSGLEEWRDNRLWLLAKIGINPKRFGLLASHMARCFAALRRPAAKCLVLDLDNTLWGGILGDLGPDGIQCAASDYPGNAYAAFQQAVLALRSRGILLAVASKNDTSLVEEAFRKRTDMPLRSDHFADWEVHWEPKPESLQRIAARLNIGLDSLVYLDDNPAEVDLVRMALPAVRAYRLPSRPEDFVDFLAKIEDFDQLWISNEDARRADLYEVRKRQTELAAKATDLESFYRSLGTVLLAEEADSSNLQRICQLFQKTNQFNLTTRRHGEPYLAECGNKGSELWAFRAGDVHGDHGIIAAALVHFKGDAAWIDSFLMSCRVIGRTLETAILAFLEERACSRGASRLVGEYLATPRNALCRDVFLNHGFELRGEAESGSEWVKNLCAPRLQCPEWIRMDTKDAARAEGNS